MSNKPLRIGSRNMNIVAPSLGQKELRPDLDKFAADVVLETPSFDNPHHALLERGPAWFGDDLTMYEAAQKAQLLSGTRLGGVALQNLANFAEESYEQFHAQVPELRQHE